MIEKRVEMVNPPTNSEMNAKTSSAVEKKPRAWLIESVLSLTTGLPGDHLDPRRAAPGRWPAARRACWPRRGHHVDVVELAALAGDGLRGGQGEGGHGRPRPGLLAVAELGDAGDGEGPGRPGGQDPDLLADAEAVTFCAVPASMTTSLASAGGRPADQVQAGQPRVRVEVHGQGGRAAGLDCLAVGRDELGVARYLALGVGHAGHGPDCGQQRLRELVADRVPAAADWGGVAGASFASSGGNAVRNQLSQSLLPTVRSVPGVATAQGEVSGYAQFIAPDGKAIQTGGAPTLAVNFDPDPRLSSLHLIGGTAPAEASDVSWTPAPRRSTASASASRSWS